ncbi:class I SAM-dependent methyltransferase [Actinomyces lilanjuaniae]|uniref:Class I SAM-dependent methyltransferase n=1 Tax=Actinomyces lilanjuaniae TaxID=2321394 RepID=A0ABN5PNT7_9ACTO|nr:class I SAM-dependent methyltransferase [Actinomyces lilanjuaniae]AYD89969.1 class I SAM-dependent methyltransferase [Actinomyces lilanjuaniae]
MIGTPQYDQVMADLYDPFISRASDPTELVSRCAPYVRGRKTLEIGIGTGRVALPLAEVAASYTGIDNSEPMLEHLLAKRLPESLSARLADVRLSLPFYSGEFEVAVSAMGSLSYVDSLEEYADCLRHVREVLAPRGTLIAENYSLSTYRALFEAGPSRFPMPDGQGWCEFRASWDGDLMETEARVHHPDGTESLFREVVLVLGEGRFEWLARQAGFEPVQAMYAAHGTPFDWFVLERGES